MEIKITYLIYERRKKRGLSIRALEKLSGVSHSQINRIENGEMHPTVYTLCLLAVALDTQPGHLYRMSLIRDK